MTLKTAKGKKLLNIGCKSQTFHILSKSYRISKVYIILQLVEKNHQNKKNLLFRNEVFCNINWRSKIFVLCLNYDRKREL